MKAENLVIVESPAKAKTIEKFLGKEFLVKSSFGHIRDLSKKNLGIDINNNFEPQYIISSDKKKIVDELKKLSTDAETVWLASDEDREGESIAWHLCEALNLDSAKIKRIAFHEITSEAIKKAIKNPRPININLVNAQQARRLLDRLVGFELSPLLWKKIKPALSAGRVQSVTVKLIVEREREITRFKISSSYRIIATFNIIGNDKKEYKLSAELDKRLPDKKSVLALLEKLKDARFIAENILTKPGKKSPAAPFTTSTLQQEASRKLGFSVAQTMTIAQKLYESGKITYMRTDSVNLAESALEACAKQIKSHYGEKYANLRRFKTKTKRAQEAHEAIRPTYIENSSVTGSAAERKLYDLIWKRTIASQMSDALIEKTTITISNTSSSDKFIASGEVIKFDGFLKVYTESLDDDENEDGKGLLPPISLNDVLPLEKIEATEKFTSHPPRYSEASLVKKLEELGIGRPSTYAPTISTIQQRGYIIREDRPGSNRNFTVITLTKNTIRESVKTETFGTEKAKLFPTDMGIIVNDFLEQHFSEIMNYNFTATVEEEFDMIAEGKLEWTKMIEQFYNTFHPKITLTETKSEKARGERILGTDPATGKQISVKIGRYGPVVQLGLPSDSEKPKFTSLLKGQSIENITLEEALELLKLPRSVGKIDDDEVVAGIGRFGPYLRYKNKFYTMPKTENLLTISLSKAAEIIKNKQEQEKNKIIKTFDTEPKIEILNGRYGPYLTSENKNYHVPKDKNPEELTLEDCRKIIAESNQKSKKKK